MDDKTYTSEEIEELVFNYKESGEKQKAAKELLDAFFPLHNKYVKILKKGTCNVTDSDTRGFLHLWIEDTTEKYKFLNNYNTDWARSYGANIASFLTDLCKTLSYDDLYQELRLITLKLADRYEDMGKSFLAYISKSFKYELRRSLKTLIEDPVIYLQNYNMYYDDEDVESGLNDSFNSDTRLQYNEKAFSMEYKHLGPMWLKGKTCSEKFKELTLVERKIIKMYYLDGLPDKDIAEELGYSRSWVNSLRKDIVEKLEDEEKVS